jgi:hypothetical protein
LNTEGQNEVCGIVDGVRCFVDRDKDPIGERENSLASADSAMMFEDWLAEALCLEGSWF